MIKLRGSRAGGGPDGKGPESGGLIAGSTTAPEYPVTRDRVRRIGLGTQAAGPFRLSARPATSP
eukprot:13376-Hanusia_phi.AAC.1